MSKFPIVNSKSSEDEPRDRALLILDDRRDYPAMGACE
jgi:hypothetical protein